MPATLLAVRACIRNQGGICSRGGAYHKWNWLCHQKQVTSTIKLSVTSSVYTLPASPPITTLLSQSQPNQTAQMCDILSTEVSDCLVLIILAVRWATKTSCRKDRRTMSVASPASWHGSVLWQAPSDHWHTLCASTGELINFEKMKHLSGCPSIS